MAWLSLVIMKEHTIKLGGKTPVFKATKPRGADEGSYLWAWLYKFFLSDVPSYYRI